MSPPADPETPWPGEGGSPDPALPEPQAPLTLLLLQGQLVLVVAIEVTSEEEGEFGVFLLLLHRHLLELGPIPRHKLRQLVDDIPQLLVCGEAAPSAPALPAPFPFPRMSPVPPDRPSPSGGSGISMAASPRAAPHGRKSGATRTAALYGTGAMETARGAGHVRLLCTGAPRRLGRSGVSGEWEQCGKRKREGKNGSSAMFE